MVHWNGYSGAYGIDDVCPCVPNGMGRGGAGSKVPMPLSEEETAALRAGAECLKGIVFGLKFQNGGMALRAFGPPETGIRS